MSARPTAEVRAEVTCTVNAINSLLAALPKEDDIGIPSDRERIWQARRTLGGIVTALTSPFEGRLTKLDRRLAERRDWSQHLTVCRVELEKELAQADGANFRLEEELRQSLRLIRNGGGEQDEFLAGPVVRWLHARGFRPEPGARSYFEGRGGLLSTEQEMAELEKERNGIIAQIECSLTYAKQFVGGMIEPAKNASEVLATDG